MTKKTVNVIPLIVTPACRKPGPSGFDVNAAGSRPVPSEVFVGTVLRWGRLTIRRDDGLVIVCLLALCNPLALAATNGDATLYQDSIQATKESIARGTLDSLYRDALDYYHDERYDDALQLLDKIYSIDPHYEDVASLRETIRKKQKETLTESTQDTVRSWMKKGDKALSAGQGVLAISYWKQALQLNPDYAPAKKKIEQVNQALAKKEFETGYIHYHHGEQEDALESWSNAIALDPTYKQKGLLLLMSKIELQVEHDQVARLAAQGFDQYQQGLLEDALHSYEDLTALEPRHEEARRMTAKIKNQLGAAALKGAQASLAGHAYHDAIEQADKAVGYDYEVSRAQAVKAEAEHAIQLANQPKPVKRVEKNPVVAISSSTVTAAPAAPAQPVNPEEAMVHYRQGMGAIRKKDFHLAIDELDIAYQLDPSNERIYMARERAKQEWAASNANRTIP
jgi:tetratricopeptide (TPR) repeat protein